MTVKSKEGFLKLPHVTIDALLRLDLTACELKICLLILSWTVGFRRHECTAGLTAIANRITTHSRRHIGKAMAHLVSMGTLEIAQAPGFRSPTRYRIAGSQTKETVSPATQCHTRHTQAPEDLTESVADDTDSVVPDTEYVAHDTLDSVVDDTQERKELYKESPSNENLSKIPPSPFKKGNSDALKNAHPSSPTENQNHSEGLRPVTHQGEIPPGPQQQILIWTDAGTRLVISGKGLKFLQRTYPMLNVGEVIREIATRSENPELRMPAAKIFPYIQQTLDLRDNGSGAR